MVIADVFVHEALQMALVEYDHMVEQIPTAVADESFGNTVLPRASEAGSLRLDAEALHGVDDFSIEIGAAIKYQILGRGVVRKCLAQLLNDPRAGRMPGEVAVQNSPPVVRDDEEAVKHAEGERGHSEEVHRGDGFAMVAQKPRPSFGRLRISRSFLHPTQHGSLRDVEAEHFQFAMNPWRAPGRVLGDHAEDEFAQFFARWPSSRTGVLARDPLPIQLESGTMPAKNNLARMNGER